MDINNTGSYEYERAISRSERYDDISGTTRYKRERPLAQKESASTPAGGDAEPNGKDDLKGDKNDTK